jgi:CheY-like chemotaxis protein
MAAPTLVSGPKHVLVVEDDAAMASVVAETLESAGHVVTVARSGDLALFHLLRGDPVDLVVSDVGMPGVDGLSLYRETSARHPALAGRFLFITGAAIDEEIAASIEDRGSQILSKPFRLERLLEIVDEAAHSFLDAGSHDA